MNTSLDNLTREDLAIIIRGIHRQRRHYKEEFLNAEMGSEAEKTAFHRVELCDKLIEQVENEREYLKNMEIAEASGSAHVNAENDEYGEAIRNAPAEKIDGVWFVNGVSETDFEALQAKNPDELTDAERFTVAAWESFKYDVE